MGGCLNRSSRQRVQVADKLFRVGLETELSSGTKAQEKDQNPRPDQGFPGIENPVLVPRVGKLPKLRGKKTACNAAQSGIRLFLTPGDPFSYGGGPACGNVTLDDLHAFLGDFPDQPLDPLVLLDPSPNLLDHLFRDVNGSRLALHFEGQHMSSVEFPPGTAAVRLTALAIHGTKGGRHERLARRQFLEFCGSTLLETRHGNPSGA